MRRMRASLSLFDQGICSLKFSFPFFSFGPGPTPAMAMLVDQAEDVFAIRDFFFSRQ